MKNFLYLLLLLTVTAPATYGQSSMIFDKNFQLFDTVRYQDTMYFLSMTTMKDTVVYDLAFGYYKDHQIHYYYLGKNFIKKFNFSFRDSTWYVDSIVTYTKNEDFFPKLKERIYFSQKSCCFGQLRISNKIKTSTYKAKIQQKSIRVTKDTINFIGIPTECYKISGITSLIYKSLEGRSKKIKTNYKFENIVINGIGTVINIEGQNKYEIVEILSRKDFVRLYSLLYQTQ